jgi:hypothetical protein
MAEGTKTVTFSFVQIQKDLSIFSIVMSLRDYYLFNQYFHIINFHVVMS